MGTVVSGEKKSVSRKGATNEALLEEMRRMGDRITLLENIYLFPGGLRGDTHPRLLGSD